MLTEDDVVAAVCSDLKKRGYETNSRTTKQRGIDITATNKRHSLVVEAKGATSNRCTSVNYGKPFTKKQCCTHVGMAFFTAASLTGTGKRGEKRQVAIALPDNDYHREYVNKIALPLRALSIGLIWVSSSRGVSYEAPWKV